MIEINKKNIYKNIKSVMVFLIVITPVLLAIYFVAFHYRENFSGEFSTEQEVWGWFGDYIGGVLNPILSFFTFIALLYTIVLQSKELRLSRKELKRSSNALKIQSESLKLQNFENSFYKLLEIHLDSISKTRVNNKIQGIYGYELIARNILNRVQTNMNNEKEYLLMLIDTFSTAYEDYSNELSRFYNIHLSLIDTISNAEKSNIESYNPTYYMNIIIRQYDDYQVTLLFFYYLALKNDSYINLLEESQFFSNLNLNHIQGFKTYLKEKYAFDESTLKSRPNLALDLICKVCE